MKFHAHLNGFTRTFDSLGDLRTWVNDLVTRYPDLHGKTLKIHQAIRSFVGSDASAAVYSSKPSHYREIVIRSLVMARADIHPDGRLEWTGLNHHERALAVDACDRILASHARLAEIAADIKRGADDLRRIADKLIRKSAD